MFKGGKATIILCNNGSALLIDPHHSTPREKALSSSFGVDFNGRIHAKKLPVPDEGGASMYKPKEEDYIYVPFRLISASIVAAGSWRATDFRDVRVLKKSMPKLKGRTAYTDHIARADNIQGVVYETAWDGERKDSEDKVIPAGINGLYKINAKRNPNLAAALLADPPEITGSSVTVEFEWVPSHEYSDKWDFYDMIGNIHEDGEMVTRRVTNIVAYHESSIVDNGADPYARMLNGDNLPIGVHYDTTWENLKLSLKDDEREAFINKPIIAKENISSELLSLSLTHKQQPQKRPAMNKKLIALIASILGKEADSFKIEELTDDQVEKIKIIGIDDFKRLEDESKKHKDAIQAAEQAKAEKLTAEKDRDDFKQKLTQAEKDRDTYKGQVDEMKPKADAFDGQVQLKRDEVKRLYNLQVYGKTQESVIKLIDEASDEALDGLIEQYCSGVAEKYDFTVDGNGKLKFRTTIEVKHGNETGSADPSQYDEDFTKQL